VLPLLLPLLFATTVEVERVVAIVNRVPILASDVDLGEVAALIPRQSGESEAGYRNAMSEALVELELRWQDLETSAIASRLPVDLDAAWRATVEKAGGESELKRHLSEIGLPESALRDLVRRAAIVEAYVASRFGPFVRPTQQEIEKAWRDEFVPKIEASGEKVPPLAEVRGRLEALLRERKLTQEVERWTSELAKRAEIVRYFR
jgi:hypothetical protein